MEKTATAISGQTELRRNSLATTDVDDIEAQIISFIIRKRKPIANDDNNKADNYSHRTYLNYVPLMLADLQNVTQRDECFDHPWGSSVRCVFDMYAGAVVTFCYCIVYGRIVDYRPKKNVYSYIIDDGTALAHVDFFKQSEQSELDRLCRLQNELEAVFRHRPGKLHESLKRIVNKTKEQVDTSSIPIGTKVLVHGIPNFFHGKTSIRAFSLHRDLGTKRDTEIAFKDELIEFYTKMRTTQTD